MQDNMFNDGWYLIDFETTGYDHLTDEIISFSISYMADYKIQNTTTYYVKPKKEITKNIQDLTGITNEMLSGGIEKSELVYILDNLPSPSPFILYSECYYVPFLKALYLSCGREFEIPYVVMDELSSHVFGYTNYKKVFDVLSEIPMKITVHSTIHNEYLQKLYELTVAVFENLEERYQISSMGELKKLYILPERK